MSRLRRHRSVSVSGLILMLVFLAASVSAQPRRHALLIGVGDYRHADDLEGPPHDVRSLAHVLAEDWGFDRIESLVDEDATRAAILGALDALDRDAASGDHVFIYFSGHGTSVLNQSGTALEASLDPGTGGLFPVEIDPTSPDAIEQLIVGRRDLRPRLERLDQDRSVFVVFDACYSGNTVRAVTCRLPRYQPWPSDPGSVAFGTQTAADAPYPYENLVYLSASSAQQVACDIREDDFWRIPTIDGQPHGALTNALLHGLAGHANTDGDSALTVRELHAYARRRIEDVFPQTPQLLHPPGRADALDRPVFELALATSSDAAPSNTPVTTMRVLVGDGAEPLRERLDGLDGVSVSESLHDLRVDADTRSRTFTVRHGSGDTLASGVSAEVAAKRIARHAAVHALLRESFAEQDFNLRLDMLERHESGALRPPITAALAIGGNYELRYESDVPAYFLMVAADVQGVMRLLVPWNSADLTASRIGRISDLVVQAPAGTEFVKLFGFRERPPGFEEWLPIRRRDGQAQVRVLDDLDEVQALLEFVRGASEVAAETSRKFVTRRR